MKVGGNASFSQFVNQHGGSSLLSAADTKAKYTGRIAELYREELAKRNKADAVRFPEGIVLDSALTAAAAVETGSTPASEKTGDDEEDFFNSWSKPSTPKPSSLPGTPRVGTPPVGVTGIGLGRTTSPANGNSTTPVAVAPKPRVGKLGSRLGSTGSTTSTASGTAKKSKLGLNAQKASAPISFEEAERKALEEEERIKQLGYDRQREEEEAKAVSGHIFLPR